MIVQSIIESTKPKKQLINQKKYYPIDSGLRYAITSTSNRDYGKSLELLVFLHLKKTHEKVFYWQETHKGEVDFIATDGKSITPYQVTWRGVEARHEEALQHFYQAFPNANEAVFVTEENAEIWLS